MLQKILISASIYVFLFFSLSAQNVGIGQAVPSSKLDINGGVTIGSGYSGTYSAPTNGAIIQGQVGVGTSSPNSSAALDITSTTQGILIPRMSTRPSSPAPGLQIFNTSNNCIEIYVGGFWQSVVCGCTAAPSTPGPMSGSFASLCKTATTPTVYSYTVPAVSGATSYTWTITGDANAIIAGQGTNSVSITFSATTATAISCTASNACGTSSAITQSLSFTSLTAPVTIAGSFSTVGTTFNANWNSSTGASGYYLDVAIDAAFTSLVSGYSSLDVGGVTTYPVSGVTCGNTYYYRVRQYTACAVSGNSNTTSATAHSTGSQTYSTATSSTTFTIPCGVTTLNFKLWGGGGGGGWLASGGGGGYVSGTYTVPSGTTSLTIVVGGGGATNNGASTQGAAGTASVGGGGKGVDGTTANSYSSGSGGGMSAVKNGSTYLLAAGGGGGGGSDDPNFTTFPYGGPGGSTTVDGSYGGSKTTAGGKSGGTSGAGAGGTGSSAGLTGTAGTAGQGGQGKGGAWTALATYEYGGGGGGGYPLGGGGGGGSSSAAGTTVTYVGGGGGGASYYAGASGISGGTSSPAVNVDGFDFNPPQNTTDANYVSAGGTAGVGGDDTPTAGTAGLVIITW